MMTARNQKRKLFPELAQAFVEFIRKADFGDSSNVYLYWHTAHPDVGWNVADLIKNNGLSHKVLLTYFCNNCGFSFPSFYRDVLTVCPRCHQGSCTTSNSQVGVDDATLARVYNCADLYVQFVTNEGLGIPCLEAAACGVPVCGTYYSGVEDLIDSLEGHPIPPRTLFTEAETGRKMALPSVDALVEYIQEFVSLPEGIRLRMGMRTAELARSVYGSWSAVAKQWMDIFDSSPVGDENQWASPIDYVNLDGLQPPDQSKMNDEQYIQWLLAGVLHRPDWCNSFVGLKMWRDLSWGRCVKNNLGFMIGELGQLGSKPVFDVCNRQTLFDLVKGMRNRYNEAERGRAQYIQMGKIQ